LAVLAPAPSLRRIKNRGEGKPMRWSSRAVATIALFLAAQSSGLAQEAGSSPEAADAKASQWDVAAPPL